jgi:chorismate mutase/prephenate dehydrogenase
MATPHTAAPAPRWNGSSDSELLELHRRDIEALDRRILHLVCERLELARQIGEIKSEMGVPLRNFQVEAQVRERFEQACSDLGLDAGVGKDLALFLINKAVEEQATLKDTAYQGDALRTLVVGGKGGMGRWFTRFLRGQGHRVHILDPAPGESQLPEIASLEEIAHDVDLIVLAVPMSACTKIIEELVELRTEAVVAEICSLKGHLLPVLERARAQGLRLVSFHPLYGPDARMLSERTIVFCTEGSEIDRQVVRGLFENTSAHLIDLDSEEHDRRMGLVLGMAHLSNLVFARSLMHSGVAAHELAEAAGVTFNKQLGTTREVAEENPALYYEIQALNATTPETGRWLEKSLQEWLGAVAEGSENVFRDLMQQCRTYLESAQPKGDS